jgi:D-arabinose 5-phosphate isomerase GutQ
VGLRGNCACTVRISEEEVSDFCSVLSLAGRVFVAGSADATTVAALFRLSLHEFGFDAHVLDTTTVCRVEPADTVVAIAGPQPDAALTAIVRIVVDTEAVVLAVATHRTAPLLGRADAAITVPWTAGSESMRRGSAEEIFDLTSLVTLHAIHRELTRRCSRDNPRAAAVDDSLPPRRAPVGSNSTFDAQLEET